MEMSGGPVEDGWRMSDTELFSRYGDVFVPRRREQVSAVCDLLADIPVPHVLDLCCGEGLLAEEYLGRSDGHRVTVLDGSAEMLELATKRLRRFGDRVSVVRADISNRDWRRESGYGGVMTSLAVHHLDGPGKRELYRDIRRMLVPGGVFVMADLIEPASAVTRKLAGDHWRQAVAAESAARFGGDEALDAFERSEWNYYRLTEPDPYDKPSSIAEHVDWLREAGFADVDVAWLFAGHAVFTGTKKTA
ncbi:MAG: class I SAM-dependent methyltransferase [Nocardiopsaceae bacterium]|nr:class I SAM-dependent methyltransferase [Nocardiopsaceae bacterium]